jgi:ligand-binding SRPBCC domain-containing protein
VAAAFTCVTEIAAPPSAVFDLSRSIDAHLGSMAASKEQAVAGVTSGMIDLGEEVTRRAVHFGLPFTMTSRITDFDRPARFVDEQVREPFRCFRHEHHFAPSGSGTVMTDRITFEAPLGPLGWLVERAALTRYLQHLIEERNDFLRRKAEEAP